jgi:hypothetical protein
LTKVSGAKEEGKDNALQIRQLAFDALHSHTSNPLFFLPPIDACSGLEVCSCQLGSRKQGAYIHAFARVNAASLRIVPHRNHLDGKALYIWTTPLSFKGHPFELSNSLDSWRLRFHSFTLLP